MGRFLKALVMTFLLMEITAIVALTAVWTGLSELHAPQSFLLASLAIAAVGLAWLAVIVFRRALAAEMRLADEFVETPLAVLDQGQMTDPAATPLNAIGDGRPKPFPDARAESGSGVATRQ